MCIHDLLHQHIVDGFIVCKRDYLHRLSEHWSLPSCLHLGAPVSLLTLLCSINLLITVLSAFSFLTFPTITPEIGYECLHHYHSLTRLTCWCERRGSGSSLRHNHWLYTLSFLVLSGESLDPVSSSLTSLLRDMMRILRVHLYPILYLTFSFVLLARPSTPLQPQVVQRAPDPELHQSSANLTGSSKRTCSGVVVCRPGIVLPVWLPLNPPVGEQAGRAVVYFFCLMYMFLGVSIIADRFMASIEVITSQVRSIFVFTEIKIAILLFTYNLRKIRFLSVCLLL